MKLTNPQIVEVVLATPLRRQFDYRLDTRTHAAELGCRVLVPFGNKQQVGIIVAFKETSDFDTAKLKTVNKVIDPSPILNKRQLQLAFWASKYYHHSLGDVCFSMLPSKYRTQSSFGLPTETYWHRSDVILDKPIASNAKKQILCLQLLEQSKQPLSESYLRGQGIEKQTLESLKVKHLIVGQQQAIEVASAFKNLTPPKLTAQQTVACASVENKCFSIYLLNGITGSGKTEVYLRLIESVLQQGKQALLLVPEIGLTPQTVKRFQDRLDFPVLTLHSGLNDTQQANHWTQSSQLKPQLVIATRSGLFAPLPKIGIIIVDEEHDASYKQQSGWLYSARDLALVRAQQSNIPVLLGSATPSLESIQKVQQGNYKELLLTERPLNQIAPKYQVLDIRALPLQQGLSKPVFDIMQSTLEKGQQVLVFLNRRGFAPVLMCHDCGWISECQRCQAKYTLHMSKRRLICHHCESSKPLITKCPDCHSNNVSAIGQGTERIEETLNYHFPNYPLVRIDRDSTRKKDAMQNYVKDIKSGKYQILIGTQMLAKGHHFPNLDLVVIVDMDSALFSSDYRASERFGQLLVQVSGRSGRGSKQGNILIQTRQPEHPHLLKLIQGNYSNFAQTLLHERAQCHWPPFNHLALLRAESPNEENPVTFLSSIKQLLSNQAKGLEVQLLGPVPAPMAKKAGKFRYQLLLQAKQRKSLHSLLDQLLDVIEDKKLAKRVRWSLDVDPSEMV